MLFLSILTMVAGYALAYAGIKGSAATIGGVPLWRKPWLPFVAAFSGAAFRAPSLDSTGVGAATATVSAPGSGSFPGQTESGAAILLADLRSGVSDLRAGITRALGRGRFV